MNLVPNVHMQLEDVPVFRHGDMVRMIDDMPEVYSLQMGHGEWNDDMCLVRSSPWVRVHI